MDIETGGLHTNYEGSSLPEPDPEADDVFLGDIPPWTPIEIIVTLLAALTAAPAIGSILLSANPFVLISGVIGLLIPPYCAFQQQKITDCKAMQETNESMDRELNNLKHENERLDVENKKLETSVSNLNNLADVLEELRAMEGVSLDSLEESLKQSKEILGKMETKKLDSVLNNIFDIVCAADADADMILSDREIDVLIKSIEGINRVQINDELAKKLIIDAGRGFDAVMELIKNALDGDPSTGPPLSDTVITFL